MAQFRINSYTDNPILGLLEESKDIDDTVIDVIGSIRERIDVGNNETDEEAEPERLSIKFPFVYQQAALELNKRKYSRKTQKWRGTVLKLEEGSFTSKLIDLNKGGTYEMAEFSIKDDISPDDLDLLHEGAVFYWNVGYVMDRGTSRKQAELRFQRVADLSTEDVDEIADNIEHKYGNIIWE